MGKNARNRKEIESKRNIKAIHQNFVLEKKQFPFCSLYGFISAMIGLWFVVPEPARWLLAKGRVADAQKVIR